MLEAKSRRGRPKGTGIDDSDRIARLAELIRTRPDLKPTTAIRAMGISDPSIIRRIRDKYKSFALSAPAETATRDAVPGAASRTAGPAPTATATRL